MARTRDIDYNLLPALLALLEERNVTRASQAANISQTAMSIALGRLRKHYGDELLVRVGRGYELTPLAETLLIEVRGALQAVSAALHPWAEFDAATSTREFTVSGQDYALAVLSAPLLAALGAQAPGVTVRFDPFPPEGTDLLAHLLRRDLLLGALGLGIPGRRQSMFSDVLVGLVAATHPRLCDGALDPAAVATMPYARASFGAKGPTLIDELLSEAGLHPRVRVTVPGLLELPFVISGTDLWAFAPQRLTRLCPSSLNVIAVDVPVEPVHMVEAAYWHPTRQEDPGHQWLRSVLTQVCLGLDEQAEAI